MSVVHPLIPSLMRVNASEISDPTAVCERIAFLYASIALFTSTSVPAS